MSDEKSHTLRHPVAERKPACLRSACCLLTCCLLFAPAAASTDWAHNEFKVGPEYCRPRASVADFWIDAGDVHLVETVSSDPQWWSTLNDPVLDRLIQNAYGQNLSLREAGWRVMQARAAQRHRGRKYLSAVAAGIRPIRSGLGK